MYKISKMSIKIGNITGYHKELVDKITNILAEDGKIVSFEYDWVDCIQGEIGQAVHISNPRYKDALVTAYTFNEQTKETFLLKSCRGETHIECLDKIYNYIKLFNEKKLTSYSWTVKWAKIENGQMGNTNTSYFQAHSLAEIDEKFFAGKERKNYHIFSAKCNPLS